MSHYMTDREASIYQSKTADLTMVGAGLVPKKTKCYACGHHRTTITGKVTHKGNFLCNGCKPK